MPLWSASPDSIALIPCTGRRASRLAGTSAEIEELLLIYPKRSGEAQPYMVACLSERDAEQQQISDKLDLGRYTRV